MSRILTALARRFTSIAPRQNSVVDGDEHRHAIPFIEALSDRELERLNELLPWHCFTLDRKGRRFGNAASASKRSVPQQIPDYRIVDLNARVPLAGREVLEVGCFEGIHTVALCQYGANVKAIDARVDNVVKTMVRSSFYGVAPRVFVRDLDNPGADNSDLGCDVCLHIGVLYHLVDPVRHLRDLGRRISRALLLDTHYTTNPDSTYESGGSTFRYQRYQEGGTADPFSGMHDHAKWLSLEDLDAVLQEVGFAKPEVLETRLERSGPRVLMLAEKGAS